MRIMVTVIFWIVLMGRGALASVPACEDSIEAKVLGADAVVRATIQRVETVSSPDPAITSRLVWRKITLQVHETLRGPTATELTVYISDTWSPTWIPPAWLGRSSEQLFFLRAGWRDAGWEPAYRSVPYSARMDPPIELTAELSDLAVGQDFHVVRSSEELLRIARGAGVLPGSVGFVTVMIPNQLREPFSSPLFPVAMFTVPLTESMFQVAREWTKSPNLQTRWCAALVLSRERSASNVAALTLLAAAPPGLVDDAHMSRLVAISTLHEWRLSPGPSELWEFGPDEVFLKWRMASVLAMAVMPGIYVWRRRGRGFRWLGLLKVVGLSVLLVMLFRSFIGVEDALACGEDDFAMRSGTFYIIHHSRPDIHLPRTLIWCPGEELPVFYNWNHSWEPYFGTVKQPLGWFLAVGWRNASETYWPDWLDFYAIRLPVWPLLLILPIPRGVRWWRAWRERRRSKWRGFPVEAIG